MIICANLWLIENHESHEFHESFFPESVRIFLLNLWDLCEPKSTHKSGIGVSLKCPPASVRFLTIKKTSEICGIRVSPKNTHKSGIRVSQSLAHKSGLRVKKKAPRMGGYHFLRSLSLKTTIAISYDFFVLLLNTTAAAITR